MAKGKIVFKEDDYGAKLRTIKSNFRKLISDENL